MWPPLDWVKLAALTKPMRERPAFGPREACQKRVAIFQVILEAQNVAFDQDRKAAMNIIYKLGRGRISYDKAYKELERYAVEPESKAPA